MKVKNNIVYILLSNVAEKIIYLRTSYIMERVTLKLGQAGVFESRDQARDFLGEYRATLWQIQPISPKTIFKARLEGI